MELQKKKNLRLLKSRNYQAQIVLTKEDFAFFLDWTELNLNNLTWQGKYQAEFEEFWNIFFTEGLSLKQVLERFDYAIMVTSIGPLTSWFNWLKEKLLCYVFIYKNLNILEISLETGIGPRILAGIFRSVLFEQFPHLNDLLNDKFQISSMADDNLYIKYKDIAQEFAITQEPHKNINDEIMVSLEVTLYKEWKLFLTKFKRHPNFDLNKLKVGLRFESQIKIIRDIILLTLIGGGIIYLVKYANKKYEDYLIGHISIYEPQFAWLNKKLSFKPEQETSISENFKLDIKKIEDIEDIPGALLGNYEDEKRFDVESEVVLTSWDALPKDFDTAWHEQSEYEEMKGRGYRESQYGRTKVYRVLIKSEDIIQSRKDLNALVQRYGAAQVDHVSPGMQVPGGIYYNLYVPIGNVKEFMAQVIEGRDAVLYESRTRTRKNPEGKNKVFIWVKSI